MGDEQREEQIQPAVMLEDAGAMFLLSRFSVSNILLDMLSFSLSLFLTLTHSLTHTLSLSFSHARTHERTVVSPKRQNITNNEHSTGNEWRAVSLNKYYDEKHNMHRRGASIQQQQLPLHGRAARYTLRAHTHIYRERKRIEYKIFFNFK